MCRAQPGDPPQDVGYCIDMSAYAPLVLPAGVTLRGGRRGTNLGPQIYASIPKTKNDDPPRKSANCNGACFKSMGTTCASPVCACTDQTRTTEKVQETPEGNRIDPIPLQNSASTTEFISIIDHNDISDWVEAGVYVDGGRPQTEICDGVDNSGNPANVRIERNFMHHNERQDSGYGAEIGSGGRALISGNTFLMNRHAIAGGGEAHERYRASYNLVLSQAPIHDRLQSLSRWWSTNFYTHDFDMHGTESGGFGGGGVNIVGNIVDKYFFSAQIATTSSGEGVLPTTTISFQYLP